MLVNVGVVGKIIVVGHPQSLVAMPTQGVNESAPWCGQHSEYSWQGKIIVEGHPSSVTTPTQGVDEPDSLMWAA